MDILNRILELRKERGWTEYRLSLEADIPQSTISSWYNKNMLPSITSLGKICDAYHITMAQFFSEGIPCELTKEQAQLINAYARLTDNQQKLLLDFLSSLHTNELPSHDK